MKTFDHEDKLEKLLEEKNFEKLTNDEKAFVMEALGSEEQYHALRRVSLALITSKADLSPEPEILNSLQKKTKELSREKAFSLLEAFTFRVPAYAVILLTLLATGVSWYFSNHKPSESSRYVEVVKRDTVRLMQVKTDTLYRTKYVYRRVKDPLPTTNYFEFVKGNEDNPPVERGVNMNEKQELEKLLVSGSR